jgi:REP element-mobilizing transposase RayT
MGHTLTNVLVHVVFATKNREKILTAAIRERLHAYLAQVAINQGARAYLVNGALEHVHLLLRLPARRPLADLVRDLKSNCSGWLRRELSPNFSWQRGYSAFSVSHSNLSAVYEYIRNQEDHHRRHTYEEELTSLLKLNELEYDERYLWS